METLVVLSLLTLAIGFCVHGTYALSYVNATAIASPEIASVQSQVMVVSIKTTDFLGIRRKRDDIWSFVVVAALSNSHLFFVEPIGGIWRTQSEDHLLRSLYQVRRRRAVVHFGQVAEKNRKFENQIPHKLNCTVTVDTTLRPHRLVKKRRRGSNRRQKIKISLEVHLSRGTSQNRDDLRHFLGANSLTLYVPLDTSGDFSLSFPESTENISNFAGIELVGYYSYHERERYESPSGIR